MSFSVSAANVSNAPFDSSSDSSSTAKAPVIKPGATQQIQDLASSGQSAAVIASSLGVPISQVEAALGISNKSSAVSQASALVALSGRLSVQA